jgi:tripartite-type tricarboxylate transporter receptor subunit TctC
VPGYEYVAMFGEFVPAGTPAAIVQRLSAEIQRCMQKPEVKEKFLNAGVESVGTTSERFSAIVKAEMAKWGKLIRETGIRAD